MSVALTLSRAIVDGGWFDLWGAAEWFALFGLVVGGFGVSFALITLDETKRQAQAAARDARLILENELAAVLEFARNDRGQILWGNVQPVPIGRQYLHAMLRNVGRYPARDIEIEIHHGDERIEAINFSDMLPAGAYPDLFQFEVNLQAEELELSLPLRFHVTHRDGNPKAAPLDACFRVSYDHELKDWKTLLC